MAKEIRLTRGLVTIVDDEDYAWARHHLWSVSGTPEKGQYAVSRIGGQMVRLHRKIMDAAGDKVVDHINGDTLDNRRENLRVCSHAQNTRNQRPRNGSFKGVSYDRGAWRADIMADGKSYRLGRFKTAIAAAVTYDQAAKRLHGEFAALNFSPDRDWIFVGAAK